MVLVPCVSAYQASTYGGVYSTGEDTSTMMSNANYRLSQMGYNSWGQAGDPGTAWNRMQSDQVFYFAGHGLPGALMFTDGSYLSGANSQNSNYDIDSFSSGQVNDMVLAVYMACNSASDDTQWTGYGNLLTSSYNRGIDNSVGFSSTISVDQSQYWSQRFMYYLDAGYSINSAMGQASTETSNQYGWWNMGGLQNNVCRGDNSCARAIDPAQAGY